MRKRTILLKRIKASYRDRLSFMIQGLTHPTTVGAMIPSSVYLAETMIKRIDFHSARYIVEFGPGTGVFTEKLLQARKPDTILLLFENNQELFNLLHEKYSHLPNLHLINDSAECLEHYLKQLDVPWVDYIVSALPYRSLPPQVSASILTQSQRQLKVGGQFITCQYTLLKKNLFRRHFKTITIKIEWLNLPPAFVFYCS